MAKEPTPKVTKALQDAFLSAYTIVGSVKKSIEAAGIARGTVYSWTSRDTYGFRERYELAKEDFRDSLQDMAIDRIKGQKPGDNPVLLITLLNAHWPEKYRRTGYMPDSAAKEIMGEWKKWVKDSKKQAKTKDEVSDQSNAIEEAERILAKKSKRKSD